MTDTQPREGDPSPWGEIQGTTILAPGVVSVHTAGHGGIWLSAERLAQMPPNERTSDSWYEEDCEAAYPLKQFLDEIYPADHPRREDAEQYIASTTRYFSGGFSEASMSR